MKSNQTIDFDDSLESFILKQSISSNVQIFLIPHKYFKLRDKTKYLIKNILRKMCIPNIKNISIHQLLYFNR